MSVTTSSKHMRHTMAGKANAAHEVLLFERWGVCNPWILQPGQFGNMDFTELLDFFDALSSLQRPTAS